MPIVVYPELWVTPRPSASVSMTERVEPPGDNFSRQNLLASWPWPANAAVVASRSQLASFPAPLQPQLTLPREWIWSGSNRIARHG